MEELLYAFGLGHGNFVTWSIVRHGDRVVEAIVSLRKTFPPVLRAGARARITTGMSDCPCGSGRSFETCCEPIINGASAPTAEALMRSRYTAYVKHAVDYLGRSLSEEQRKDFAPEDAKKWAEQSEWLGLTILRTEQGGPNDQAGLVEFSARFKTDGKEQEHLETALFTREAGEWVYAGQAAPPGQTVRRETPKVGRNDPCPCGSGKKYKKCCGAAA